jgi:hypothetical protein
MARVYLETSFVSACVSDRKDPGSIHRRERSLEWWAFQAQRHDLFTSSEVMLELSSPRLRRRRAALEFIHDFPTLTVNQDAVNLAEILIKERVMPGPIAGDAIHVAVSAVAAIEYILSWNVRHLANQNKTVHLGRICARHGFAAPRIVTPEMFWEDNNDT